MITIIILFLALALIISMMNNAQKNADLKTLKYEVAYLQSCLFHENVPSRNDTRK